MKWQQGGGVEGWRPIKVKERMFKDLFHFT